jgi:hypothetical protein
MVLWKGIKILILKVLLGFQRGVGGMVFLVLNATFNNISVISWQSVSLVVETRRKYMYPEKTTDLPQVTDKFYFKVMEVKRLSLFTTN